MRGLISTNYDIQSLDDIKEDLINWQRALEEDIDLSETLINSLNTETWKNVSNWDKLKSCIKKSLFFLKTSLKDISQINSEINVKIIQRHVKILRHIGDEASNLNFEIGQAKNNGDRFSLDSQEEKLYSVIRNMLYDLIDLQPLSERLENYIDDAMIKDKMDWTKISAIVAIVGVVVTIVFGIVTYFQTKSPTENIIQDNVEKFILNNNGNINKTNTEVNNK